MARKDDIFRSFMEHDILKSKYEIKQEDIPKTVREAEQSEIKIVKTIALIVKELESSKTISDVALHKKVTQFLNNAI